MYCSPSCPLALLSLAVRAALFRKPLSAPVRSSRSLAIYFIFKLPDSLPLNTIVVSLLLLNLWPHFFLILWTLLRFHFLQLLCSFDLSLLTFLKISHFIYQMWSFSYVLVLRPALFPTSLSFRYPSVDVFQMCVSQPDPLPGCLLDIAVVWQSPQTQHIYITAKRTYPFLSWKLVSAVLECTFEMKPENKFKYWTAWRTGHPWSCVKICHFLLKNLCWVARSMPFQAFWYWDNRHLCLYFSKGITMWQSSWRSLRYPGIFFSFVNHG